MPPKKQLKYKNYKIMKKIFCAVLALAAMASCSKEHTVDYNKQAIAFGEAFVENSTRAAIDNTYTDSKKVTEFNVYGTVQGTHDESSPVFIFNGDIVKNNNGTTTVGYDDVWFCDNVQYWVPNADYKFTAVVDGVLDTTDNTIDYNVSDQTDLLLATATASVNNAGTITGSNMGENGLVKFQFNHLLSKAYFTFKTNAAFKTDEYTYEISNIQFDNAYTEGTYKVGGIGVNSGAWTASNTDELSFGAAVTLAPSMTTAVETTSEYVKVFIPQEDVMISFTATIKYLGTPISVKNYTFDVFKSSESKKSVAGHQYNFVVEFTENNTIKFSVDDVTDWVVDGDITLQ